MSDAAVDLQPTPERIRRMRRADPERVMKPMKDQKTAREAWRLKPIIDALVDDEHIRSEAKEAYDRFERDCYTGFRDPSCIAGYGSSGSQGTPAGQMVVEAMERAEFREVRRFNAADRARDALESVRREACRRALVMSLQDDVTLVDIGRSITRFHDKAQARASAITLLQEATWDLLQHYDPGSTG